MRQMDEHRKGFGGRGSAETAWMRIGISRATDGSGKGQADKERGSKGSEDQGAMDQRVSEASGKRYVRTRVDYNLVIGRADKETHRSLCTR